MKQPNKHHNKHKKQKPAAQTLNVEIDYFRLQESLYRKEIADWQNARTARYDTYNPLTFHLQQLYKDAMLDNHLQGAVESRILRILNKEFVLKNKEGTRDNIRSIYVQKRWFRQLIRKAMESKFFGYSMILINTAASGDIRSITEIPRENVLPERKTIIKDAMQPDGEAINYTMFPNNLIYIQISPNPIGILERIAPMTIYKRHSWASWDEFEQIFGVPVRIARTMINTEKHKNELQKWLETMGTASYGIFDKQTDIEIKENSARGDAAKIFLDKIAMVNKEISKGIVGQTMTMDDGSSESQAKVHLAIYQDYTDADIMDIQDWVSDDFIPVMRNAGYDIPEGYYFELVEKNVIKPENKIKVDEVLLRAGYNLTPQYIQDTYEVEMDPENPRTEIEKTLSYAPAQNELIIPPMQISSENELNSFFA
jgi:hypothetical protein